jgi:hypothetical protein
MVSAQEAPGALEDVRDLLNSWLIRNDTRQPDDRFAAWAAAHAVTDDDHDTVRRLRDDLRAALDDQAEADAVVNRWIELTGLWPQVESGAIRFRHDGSGSGPAGELVATVVTAIADGRWARLKTCPDCRWAFYDHTRNGGKRWCLMTAGRPGGRSCGSIAKVRAYRARQASGASVPGMGSAGAG